MGVREGPIRTLIVFSVVAALHFILSALGLLFVLPAAFETQGGQGFWAAPGKSILAWLPGVLLAPLAWLTPPLPLHKEFGFLDIALVSAMFGAVAVGLHYFWRTLRGRR